MIYNEKRLFVLQNPNPAQLQLISFVIKKDFIVFISHTLSFEFVASWLFVVFNIFADKLYLLQSYL